MLAFVVVPLVEIYVLIQVGQVIGPWWTILLLIADSILGAWLIRREGRRAWLALTTALNSGQMPAKELADGALILVGGTLMLSPGFVTDGLGILLILPFTRPVARRLLTKVVSKRLRGRPDRRTDGRTPRTRPGPGGPVVRGEVVDEDDLETAQADLTRFLAVDRLFASPRCRWAGPISPPRSSSRRSLRMSSSSFSDRRSSSMSQWVRAGFSTFTSGSMPDVLSAFGPAARALPDRRHVGLDRHGDLEGVSSRAQVTDLLTGRELDAALVLEALAS